MLKSQLLFFSCLGFVFGIGFFSFFSPPIHFLYFLFSFILFFSFLFFKEHFFFLLFFLGSFFLAGLRFNFFLSRIFQNPIFYFFEREIEIEGKVLEILKREKKFQEVLLLTNSQNSKVIFRTPPHLSISIGERVKIKGKLKKPTFEDDLEFQNPFLAKGIVGYLFFPKIEFQKREKSDFLDFILLLKNTFKEKIEKIFPRKYSFWVQAFLLGVKENFPQEEIKKLQKTGLSHLIVISGLHFSLLSLFIFNLLVFLQFPRKISLFLSILFIFLYLSVLGFKISATRSAFMLSFLFLSQIFGRPNSSQRTLIFVSAIFLFLNPLLLRYDLSFQFSFLATFGLVYFYPSIVHFFEKVPNFLKLKETILVSLSAQIFIIPLLIWYFGYFSLIFPIANAILLFIFPFLLSFSFLALFVSFFSLGLAKIFAFSAIFFLDIFQKIVDFFSKYPIVSFSFSHFWLFYSYFLLFSFCFFLKKKFDQPFFLG